jgi:membrane associated rhomboid family serine protease
VRLGTIGAKLAHIYLPLLVLAVAFVGLYSLANWFLVAPGLVPLDQEVANLWLPGALGVILAGVLIAPRLRVLKLSEKRNAPLLYQAAAMAVLIAPALFAQSYVTTASGALTHVKSADMIYSAPRTRYYAADVVCIDFKHPRVRRQSEVSGRNNEYLEFKIYVLTPVCSTAGRRVWIGFLYTDTIDNSDSRSFRESKYREFLQKSQKQYDDFDPARIRYLELLGRTADRRSYEKALAKDAAALQSPPIILIPHQDAFEARNGQKLAWTFYSFAIAAGVFLLLLLIPSLDREKLADARKPRGERAPSKPNTWLALLLPSRDAYGLALLVDINLAVFLAMVFCGLGVISFQSDDLLAWGGNYGPAIHGLGVYRLISCQFVHVGLLHIGSNLYGLLIGGVFLAPVVRKAGLIACYLACGLGGSIASLTMHPATVAVGASGAIMGLWGIALTLALLGDQRIAAARWVVVVNCLIFGGLTLAQGFANPEIDNAAHIGGLVTGVVIGLLTFLFSWGDKLEVRSGSRVPAAR